MVSGALDTLIAVYIIFNSLTSNLEELGQHPCIIPAAQTAVNYKGEFLEQTDLATRLQSLVRDNEADVALLPEEDPADPRPLPLWFRVFLRKTLPGLPKSGRPQYPKEAVQLLQWLHAHPNFSEQGLDVKLAGLRKRVPSVIQENEKRAKYPKEWEIEIPKGTALDHLRQALDDEFELLPPKDLEDKTSLPIWFRVYLRKRFPKLPTRGPYQYPRTATRILRWMITHPNTLEEQEQ